MYSSYNFKVSTKDEIKDDDDDDDNDVDVGVIVDADAACSLCVPIFNPFFFANFSDKLDSVVAKLNLDYVYSTPNQKR